MIGTDGGRYTYLFKGLEDLHLDERIMQFLGKEVFSLICRIFLLMKLVNILAIDYAYLIVIV